MSFKKVDLFGGALTVSLPSSFSDTSTIREVPDHQEVHLSSTGYTSIVLELLEYVDKPTDAEALQYHFADLVDGTGDATNILSEGGVEFADGELKTRPAYGLTFIQTPAPPTQRTAHRKVPEFVYIHLLLLRLKEQGTDVMVTVNVPHYTGEYKAVEGGGETELMKDGGKVRDEVLRTLRVVEWGVFDG